MGNCGAVMKEMLTCGFGVVQCKMMEFANSVGVCYERAWNNEGMMPLV